MVLLLYIGAVHHTVGYTAKCGQQIPLTGDILYIYYWTVCGSEIGPVAWSDDGVFGMSESQE